MIIDIIYEDKDILVVVKPAGIDVHGKFVGQHNTLITILANQLGIHPQVLHPASRLDKPVSGLVPIARTPAGKKGIAKLYEKKMVHRNYIAVCIGIPEPKKGEWTEPIGPDPKKKGFHWIKVPDAKESCTGYQVKEIMPLNYSLIELAPKTGRTHQLRVHLSAHGFPIVGDTRYGNHNKVTFPNGKVVPVERILLQSYKLNFPHPITNKSIILEISMDKDIKNFINLLHNYK